MSEPRKSRDTFLERPSCQSLGEPLAAAVAGVARGAADTIGTRRGRSWSILATLGEGGMGRVYLARPVDAPEEPPSAFKELLFDLLEHGEAVRRFQRERKTLSRLYHPGVVAVREYGRTDIGLPYFVMDYVAGRHVDQHCRGLSVAARVRLFQKICRVVGYVHRQGVIHRDLKPSNILVTPDEQVKVLDFGIAKVVDPEHTILETLTGEHPLTPLYASPEQWMDLPVTAATDIYSLGLVLFQILTEGEWPYDVGNQSATEVAQAVCKQEALAPSTALLRREEPPENGPTVSELHWSLVGKLDRIVLRALEKKPEHRWATADELADSLELYLRSMQL